MMILAALLVTVCAMGAQAQHPTCTPPSFTATALATVEFAVYDIYNSADDQVSYSKNKNGDEWRIIDTNNHAVYNFDGQQCNKTVLSGDLGVSRDDLFRDANLEYSFDLPDNGGSFSAWSYKNGSLSVHGLFDEQCVSVVTNIAVNDVPVLINVLTNIETENPDIQPLKEKLAWAQQNC